MAHVHLAASTGPLGFAKLVVLKILRPELVSSPETVAMFLDEARLAARLSHPSIVQTFEVGTDRGHYFLAMEHLEGQPLHRVLRKLSGDGALTAALAIHVLFAVLDGLEHAHELTNDRDFLIKHVVFVRSGATLRIAAGTTLRGDYTSKGTLVVEPGARLVVEGTVTDPVVFTSNRPQAVRAAGDWGGVIVLGNAPTNRSEGTRVEGLLTRGTYGGDDPEDSSGSIAYARIEYAGHRIAPNNEINGLTLAGVGRGTRIHHVQVRYPLGDCFELFGGTARISDATTTRASTRCDGSRTRRATCAHAVTRRCGGRRSPANTSPPRRSRRGDMRLRTIRSQIHAPRSSAPSATGAIAGIRSPGS